VQPLTEQQVRACFVNASRREAANATLPDLSAVDWERCDYLGWRDTKAPLSAYVVLEVDGAPVGLLLRGSSPSVGRGRRAAVCAWCTDVVEDDVTLYVTRRGGASGRQGNTVGTLICTEFRCSDNVRRPLPRADADAAALAAHDQVVARRVDELRERSQRFAREVLSTR
jgi:FBP C-terminal treble-clef zinc-finger